MPGKANNAGIICDGPLNPNWKGGPVDKTCRVCGNGYVARRAQAKSRFCSLQCVGISQRGKPRNPGKPLSGIEKRCINCGKSFTAVRSRAAKRQCCSVACKDQQHGSRVGGEKNPNWCGGLRLDPYPWYFKDVSRAIIKRDNHACQNPTCRKNDSRLTAHHIDYNKENCDQRNLITLCRSCNSRANFGREKWLKFYTDLVAMRLPRSPPDQLPLALVIVARMPVTPPRSETHQESREG